ncbi:carbohydrate porin [Phormidium sp. LEGE 05292]|uniref:iron uptake porin n=1 Tax=[Phormidium] sp. LEGE 05292 TaxID=767427 RepID=UPI001881ECFD|nr:iron uptake porin [Phormidium sp. LEGE 05292]MBE9228349.1 carbohydrate porin [Phormidium sp. LEGE 05292]
MSKILWKSLLFSPAILGATLVFSPWAIATETNSAAEVASTQTANPEQQLEVATKSQASGNQLKALDKTQNQAQESVTAKENTVAQAAPVDSPNSIDEIIRYSREGNRTSAQVTSVSQLRDVQPTDWAFQALQSLVERYGCIEGYPDRTYRGNRALTRYEFAAGLNSCLDRIQELIAALPQGVSKEDLAALQRLQEEFAAELATLRGRVDSLEARVTKVEAQQFSTTTKLKGEAIFAISDVWGGQRGQVNYRGASNGRWGVEDSNNTVFQDRVRLEFQTSFTGRDILHTRISAGNGQRWNNLPYTPLFNNGAGSGFNSPAGAFAGPTAEGTLQYFVGSTGNNSVALDWLAYETAFLGGSKLYLAATGGIHSDYVDVKNPYFFDGDGGNGSISAFSQENPIYRIGGGAGGAISFGLGGFGSFLKGTSITGGYFAGGSGLTIPGNSPGSANSPLDKNGLFDGNYAALGQLDLNFCDTFNLALTYVNAYHTTGSDIFDAGGGFGARLVGTGIANLPSALIYGRNATPIVTNSYGVSGNLRLSKYFSISAFGMYTDATLIRRGSADIWSYGLGVALPNLGKPGNLLGLFAGIEPYVTGMSAGPRSSFSRDMPWHIEGFYKFQLTDNISLTPGVIWLMAPEQNNDNDDIFIGTLRTTFTF